MARATHVEYTRCVWPSFGVDIERRLEEIPEGGRELFGIVDLGCAIGRDEIQRAQRILVEIRWLALDHFYPTKPHTSQRKQK